MGYAMAFSACAGCGRTFGYNPHRVPSVVVAGAREPICGECVAYANPMREANGLPPITVYADAYEPIPESDL